MSLYVILPSCAKKLLTPFIGFEVELQSKPNYRARCVGEINLGRGSEFRRCHRFGLFDRSSILFFIKNEVFEFFQRGCSPSNSFETRPLTKLSKVKMCDFSFMIEKYAGQTWRLRFIIFNSNLFGTGMRGHRWMKRPWPSFISASVAKFILLAGHKYLRLGADAGPLSRTHTWLHSILSTLATTAKTFINYDEYYEWIVIATQVCASDSLSFHVHSSYDVLSLLGIVS